MPHATPRIHPSALVAPGAVVVGNVEIGPDASVWYNAVVRGDMAPIRIGARTNIQDGAILHGSANRPVELGSNVIVGHAAVIHGCTVEDGSLIGMGAIVLNGAHVGSNCIVGAGSLVTEGTTIPSGSVAFGSPARVVRPVSDQDLKALRDNAEEYVRLAHETLA